MHRTRIKICGITRVEDALAAARAGADAIGLIFYPPSPRGISLAQAIGVARELPPFVSTVALFVNATVAEVGDVVRALRPALLQFHGDEDRGFCEQFAMPYLKAVRVGSDMQPADLLECESRFPTAKALLLDTMLAGVYGGSGESFDWAKIPPGMRSRIVLSGGLNPGNVAIAVRAVHPWAVDVSSGVEAQKGIKDHQKIARFIEAVKNADV
jgi:phosphoribosylanthranilate isomerase